MVLEAVDYSVRVITQQSLQHSAVEGGRDRVLSLRSVDVDQLGRHTHTLTQSPSRSPARTSAICLHRGALGPQESFPHSFRRVVDREDNTHFVFLAFFSLRHSLCVHVCIRVCECVLDMYECSTGRVTA